jgi:hypothetical protein
MKINLNLENLIRRAKTDLEDLKLAQTKEEFDLIIDNLISFKFLDFDLVPETEEEKQQLETLKDIRSDIRALQLTKKF